MRVYLCVCDVCVRVCICVCVMCVCVYLCVCGVCVPVCVCVLGGYRGSAFSTLFSHNSFLWFSPVLHIKHWEYLFEERVFWAKSSLKKSL